MTTANAPHALLFTAPGCPHCPGVKAALETLHKEGLIGELEVASVAEEQERAAELGVRSVPWLRLGEFTLTGAQTPQQLRQWAEKAATGDDPAARLENLLANAGLDEAQQLLDEAPSHAGALLSLLDKPDTPTHVRIGASALLEGLEGSETLRELLPELARLSRHSSHQVRSDACHLLGLTHSPDAVEALQTRLEDENPEVREIAGESIEALAEEK